MSTVVADLVYQRVLPTRFASCPPAFGLLLDLRKTHQQPALEVLVMTSTSDLILPSETCKRIGRSLVMRKDKEFKRLWRKHENIPL